MTARGITKVILFVAFCIGASTAWRCPDALTLNSNLTTDNTFTTEIGFNTTYPLITTVNGTVEYVVPWVNISRMWIELNFTGQQRIPLTELLQEHQNASFAALTYNCNLTTLNCTVHCSFGDQYTGELGESGSENGSDVCTEGYRTDFITNSSEWIHRRWNNLCGKMITLILMEPSLAWLKLVGNDTVRCEYNTSIPIQYNITMYGTNLTTIERECDRDENRTVICVLTNSTRDIHNMSSLGCTIHRPPWPVWTDASFNRSDEDLEGLGDYYYDDDDYYYYDDEEIEYVIHNRDDYEYDEDEEKEEEETEEEPINAEENNETGHHQRDSHHAKSIGDRPKDDGNSAPASPILIVGILALATVGILAIVFRKRLRKPREIVYRTQSASPY